MNSGKHLITGIVVLVAIILIFLFLPQFDIFNKNEIPESVTREVNCIINQSGKQYVNRWEANSTQQKATIYYNCIYYRDENKKFDGKKVDGWTISIVVDPESYNETAYDALEARFKKLEKGHPELQLTYFEYHECKREFWLIVRNFTAENRKLNGEVWEGWKIVVAT